MKHFSQYLVWLAAAHLAIIAAPSDAQELRGRIFGVVSDSTGGVLPGVVITAKSPALIQPQVTITGQGGSYRFPALPTGVYSLTFELPGFQTLVREGLRVNLNVTLTVNAELQIAGVEETLIVTGESPVVDAKTTTTAANFTKEILEDIPKARDMWAAMAQAPGFYMVGYDVGGSHMGTATPFRTSGGGGQVRVLYEGINVDTATAGYADFGAFEDLQLSGAGNMAETDSMGAFFNITVKSGGDDFHGTAYLDFENEDTISDNLPEELRTGGGEKDGYKAPPGGLERGNPIEEQTDINLGLGGPILPGKAWFYAGYRRNNQYKIRLGIPDPAQTKLENYTVKGTWAIDSRNQLIGFYNRRSKLQPERYLSLSTPLETSWYQDSVNVASKLEWTSTPSDRTYLDVQYSYWNQKFPLYPQSTRSTSVEGAPIGRMDVSAGQRSGSASYYHEQRIRDHQVAGNVSYYRDDWQGTHNFKFGAELFFDRVDMEMFQPGDIYYFDASQGVPDEVWIYNTPNTATNDATLFAFYAQDSWTLGNRLTLNLGARLGHQSIGWPVQSYAPNQSDFFEPVSVEANHVISFTDIGPRLGLAYDLNGKGKTVLKVFFGRFYNTPDSFFAMDENPVGTAMLRYRFNDLNGNLTLDPGPDGRFDTSPELGRFLSTVGGAGFVRVDREMTNAWGQELSAHFEHELAESLSVRGSYIWKLSRNRWSTVDVERALEYTIPYDFYDKGEDNIAGTEDDQVISLFDTPPNLPSDRVTTNPQRFGLPEYEEDYHTFEMVLNRRFQDKWLFLSSFLYTLAEDYRRTSSSSNPLHPAGSGPYYHWQPNMRRFGKQPSSWWAFKTVGRYVFPYDVGFSASYRYQSGLNVVRRVAVRLPNAGREWIRAEPVNSERAPDVGILDIRFEKAHPFPGRLGRLTGMVDIFNLFNSNPIINYRIDSGSRYKEVIAILDPRIVRFGIRYEF